jgi:hypothetical protein
VADAVTARTLNRTTLQRQLLLERSPLDALSAVHRLVGLQAQVPANPYPALWSRLDGFAAADLGTLLSERKVVRIASIRGTIHLLTADDCLAFWPLFRPVFDRELAAHPEVGPALVGVDLGPVLDWARAMLAEEPLSLPALRAALGERFPQNDAAALAYACRNHLALVQVPPRGVLGRSHQVTVTTAEAWLGRPLAASPSVDDLVLRYLRVFGPATAADIATFSRLTGIAAVLDRLDGQLRQWPHEAGRTLWDIADGELADPETPAPVRLLPEYDNVLLAHADRSRFFEARPTPALYPAGRLGRGHVLVDGTLRGSWRIADGRRVEVLHLPLSRHDLDATVAVANRLAAFLHPDDPPVVTLTAV